MSAIATMRCHHFRQGGTNSVGAPESSGTHVDVHSKLWLCFSQPQRSHSYRLHPASDPLDHGRERREGFGA
jgi:hypothetical protein